MATGCCNMCNCYLLGKYNDKSVALAEVRHCMNTLIIMLCICFVTMLDSAYMDGFDEYGNIKI